MATFTEITSRYTGGTTGKELIVRRGSLVLEIEGGNIADCPASLFNFSKIVEVSSAINNYNTRIVLFAVATDGSGIAACDLEESADEDRSNLASLTGTFVLNVTGY